MDGQKRVLGNASAVDDIAMVVFGAILLWGLWLCLQVVYGALGLVAAVIGAILFPLLLIVAPWYALIAQGNPMPVLLCYGAVVVWALIAMPARAWRLYRDK